MSVSERERAAAMRQIADGVIDQRTAAERLDMGVRQVKRLYRAWRIAGEAGLVSKQRGRFSPLRISPDKRLRIETLLHEKYPDFGATFAAEKLAEVDGIAVSRETVRKIQISCGLATAKRRKGGHVHQPRERRPRFGELIQIDGSPHDWFEGRGPRCNLTVFIDDATSRLTALHFTPTETTAAYLDALRTHVLAHGRPLALYSDRHGIFRVNAKEAATGDGLTEFGRVVGRLNIANPKAKTAQAKGRVERANLTLQDRLVKEMRLAGVSSMEQGEAYADAFIEKWNRKFGRLPRDPEDAHRPWMNGEAALDEAMARRETRTLSKALTFSLDGRIFCVVPKGAGLGLRRAKVTIFLYRNGEMRVRYRERDLVFSLVKTTPRYDDVVDEKTLDGRMDDIVAMAALEDA
jgi:transposase